MPEPLEEAIEVSWLEFLNRFNAEIYPTLFESQGLTKAEAMIVWSLAKIEQSLDALTEKMEDKY